MSRAFKLFRTLHYLESTLGAAVVVLPLILAGTTSAVAHERRPGKDRRSNRGTSEIIGFSSSRLFRMVLRCRPLGCSSSFRGDKSVYQRNFSEF